LILLMTPAPPINSAWGLPMKLPPLGLAYVAAALEKSGFQVEVLDNYLLKKPIDEVKQTVRRLNPEIVGITCSSVTYQRCVETAKAVKEVLPSCKVVVGGWHPSYVPDSMLQHPDIDYVIMGEGERAMVELVTHITKGGDDRAIATIASVAYRHEGKLIKNAPRFISNLDEVPFPARHLLPMHLYDRAIEFLRAKPVDIANVVRGCPYNCAFCETRKLWGQTCRAFSPNRVVEEINHLVTSYGTKGIYFVGDNFTIQKKRTVELCELIKKSKLDVEWVCDTRADMISRDLLRKMKEAGCKTIWFGVESGSPRILEKINKGIALEQTAHAFKICREEGIQIACSFILGVPGETANDMEATFRFAKKLDPDWCQFNIFIACPGSDLYEEVMQKGLYDRVEGFLAFVKTEDFNYDSLLEVQKRFHREFNRSPKRILRKIRREGFWAVLRKSPRYFCS
jgi:anaerobic magnesium-protoporphyrin IX monomethyl ester cyclase